jgi:hypothetical protein
MQALRPEAIELQTKSYQDLLGFAVRTAVDKGADSNSWERLRGWVDRKIAAAEIGVLTGIKSV